jgi:hypothetical protein
MEPEQQNETLRLAWMSPEELAENPANWRTHPETQKAALDGVLREVGWAGACLYNERTNRLVDGHLRRKVAYEQGTEKIPVLIGSWSEADEKKILATLDPLSAMAEANTPALDALLREVTTESGPLAAMLAKLAEEHGIIPAEAKGEDPGADIDRAAELQAKWGTAPGQLWVIPSKSVPGKEHRILCGDSTSADDVARVMEGEKADCVLTDPVYGIDQAGVPGDGANDLSKTISGSVAHLPIENGICVAFASPRTFPVWLDCVREAGHSFERMLWIYKTAQCVFPWRGWLLTSEAILVSTIGDADWQEVHPFSHDCYQVSEVSGELDDSLGWHGSVKPIAIVKDLMARICAEGSEVFDGFLGSGTTMVAAEQLGRVCRGMELEPKYVAVCLERLKGLGLEPKLS